MGKKKHADTVALRDCLSANFCGNYADAGTTNCRSRLAAFSAGAENRRTHERSEMRTQWPCGHLSSLFSEEKSADAGIDSRRLADFGRQPKAFEPGPLTFTGPLSFSGGAFCAAERAASFCERGKQKGSMEGQDTSQVILRPQFIAENWTAAPIRSATGIPFSEGFKKTYCLQCKSNPFILFARK